MPYCAILECKNDSRRKNLKNGGISYHRFPNDPSLKEIWIDATGRIKWMPSKLSTICSEHFLEDDFLISNKGYRYAKPTAYPSMKIFKHYNLIKKKPKTNTDLGDKLPHEEVDVIENNLGLDVKRNDNSDNESEHTNESNRDNDDMSNCGSNRKFRFPNIVYEDDDECELYTRLLAKKLRRYSVETRHRLMYNIDGLLIDNPCSKDKFRK